MTGYATRTVTFKEIGEALETVRDPEIHQSITELGLVYGANIGPAENGGARVGVLVTLTSPTCPYGPMLLAMIHGALAKLPGVRDVGVDLTFDPVWDPRSMASEDCRDALGIY